ncbi:MAG: zinc metalloprotease HtpX [Gemmatimonadota bacterium]|jgi:heat shock protein HtpX|nr:zinc metalloprotease HtpX [Gemmatimonadota bacterium]
MEKVKVVGLMTLLSLMLVGIGGYVGGSGGAMLFFIISLVMNVGMYWFSDRIVLKQYRAHIVRPGEEGGRFDSLYAMVDRLRQNAGMPMPVVAISGNPQPNAFATGRNPQHAVVCVTRGMWDLVARGYMTVDELEAVIAHELGHIRHYHMLVGTIAASAAGAVMMIANMLKWGALFGFGGGRDGENNNPLALIGLAVLAPVAAMMVQMMISRRNEFEADAEAARISGKPMALASALKKIDSIAQRHPMEVSAAAAHLAIINPLSGGGMMKLFSTHPPTAERVAKLQQIAGETGVA